MYTVTPRKNTYMQASMKERRVHGCQKWRGNTSQRKGEVATVLAHRGSDWYGDPDDSQDSQRKRLGDFLSGDVARKLVITQTLGEK